MLLKKFQQIEYFISLLIESHPDLDLSDAEDTQVYEYHHYRQNAADIKKALADIA